MTLYYWYFANAVSHAHFRARLDGARQRIRRVPTPAGRDQSLGAWMWEVSPQ